MSKYMEDVVVSKKRPLEPSDATLLARRIQGMKARIMADEAYLLEAKAVARVTVAQRRQHGMHASAEEVINALEHLQCLVKISHDRLADAEFELAQIR